MVIWRPSKPLFGERVDWDAWGLPSPVGEWWLNEGSGSLVNDSSGNGNTGTLTNMDPATDWSRLGDWSSDVFFYDLIFYRIKSGRPVDIAYGYGNDLRSG